MAVPEAGCGQAITEQQAMDESCKLTRRAMVGGALGLAAAGMGLSSAHATPATRMLDLQDPQQRVKARAKALGSIAAEVVYTFYRLHLYGYMHGGNLVPFFTLNNLNITRWTPLPNGNYATVGAECGVYCKFDTDEVLDVWENPITHEKRPVWEFIGGPLKAEIGPDGVVTGGVAELHPRALRMEVLGDKLFVPSEAALSHPNPFDPEIWPKSSTEKTRHWDSHFLCAANVADIVDPSINAAPAFGQFQNLGTWHPWLGMGGHPGRTWGKAYGGKLKTLNQLPKAVLLGIEKKTPEIFSFESWEKPRIDFLDYKATHKPE